MRGMFYSAERKRQLIFMLFYKLSAVLFSTLFSALSVTEELRSPPRYGDNIAPKLRQNRFKYSSTGVPNVTKEVVGTRALPTRSFFGGGIPRGFLRPVSLAKLTSVLVRF
jgi:hypothetical protein